MVATAAPRKVIKVESVAAVLALHWYVARDEGLFEAEGLEVEIVTPPPPKPFAPGDPRLLDPRLVDPFNYQNFFEQNACDVFRGCEWGQIRRADDSKRGGPIAFRRPAMVCQGIYVRLESPVDAPIQLAGKTVGVQFHQGSHYATIAMLHGFLRKDEIKPIHVGPTEHRYEKLERGEVDAATLMEPWITLAEKNGFKKIIETHYLGVENISQDLDRGTLDKLTRAIREAVVLINADKKKHIHHMLDEIPEKYRKQLSPDDFHLPRLRYVEPAPYTEAEFERARRFMVEWDLIAPDATYDKLVANVI
ncbi:MAG TPA: ABC transporter substrate-binding protein [Methylomirabilota bacterium]|jgi:NitT/TauT family transport system substrate-binding protein|nr:ABC transporter substrate-binding protein [Methylomirabilota bacterium]